MNTDTDITIDDDVEPSYCCSIDDLTPVELEKRMDTVANNMKIGIKCINCKDFEHAARCFDKVLSVKREMFVETHLEIANTFEFLATIAGKRRKWKECQQYWSNALDIYLELLGHEHETYLYALVKEEHAARKAYLVAKNSNLSEEVKNHIHSARLDIKAKNYGDAHEQSKKALGILKMCVGINTLEVAAVREIQADIYVCQGKYADARSIYEGVLRVVGEKSSQSDERHQNVFIKLMGIAGLRDEDL